MPTEPTVRAHPDMPAGGPHAARIAELRQRFRALHRDGTFVMPNPFDVGSARLLEHLGFPALATTSSGFAATLGRPDQHVAVDELAAHVVAVVAAVSVPVSVDAEHCFADTAAGVADTVELLAAAGASGVSIEDHDPVSGGLYAPDVAAERVAVAADACRRHGIVLTARAENHLYGVDDLDDTVARLTRYVAAGADAAYAPGLVAIEDIERVVREVAAPLNVLARRDGPAVPELAAVGVRRVSTGGALAWAAYGALVSAAQELAGPGTSSYLATALGADVRARALAPRPRVTARGANPVRYDPPTP